MEDKFKYLKNFDSNMLTPEQQVIFYGEPFESSSPKRNLNVKKHKSFSFMKSNTKYITNFSSTLGNVKDSNFFQKLVINYNSNLKSTWDIYLIILVVYSCITTIF